MTDAMLEARTQRDHVVRDHRELLPLFERWSPKRAILFRTDTPFRKITAPLIAPNGINDERIEFLADGQLVVVDGIHPDTRAPYRWFGGVPWDIARDQLPYLHPHEAQQLVEDIVKILIGEFRLHGDVSTRIGPRAAGPPRRLSTGMTMVCGGGWKRARRKS